MNILVITREFPPHVMGGLSYHLKFLYEKLSERGHKIEIIAGKCSAVEPTHKTSVDESISVHWAPYPTPTAHHIQFPISAFYILRNINLSKFDIAVTHTEIPFQINLPVVEKIHDSKQRGRKYMRKGMTKWQKMFDTLINPTRRWVEKQSIDSADRLIFNSYLSKNIWMNQYECQADSVVIHNGVDTDLFYPRETTISKEYLLFVGDQERKGLSKIQDFASISPFPIYVVGNTDPKVANTKYLGYLDQEELARYYSSAKATIHPALFEAFGNVVLESLACGTPVVASPNCGASEIIDPSCGIVTEDLESAIQQLETIDSEDCVHQAKKHSWENVADRTEQILKSTASPG